ncbi:MAG: sulfotransferase [Proteobacteria bacterium]|nr:sulfotransferase [Pseudomonadota bacterium]HQR04492.1 sulfotransferase [Rhodocyclaceae bacterium]
MSTTLETDALLDTACRRTGFADFGDPWFLEPLQVLLRSITGEAALNDTGRTIYGERLLGGLVNRLRIRDFIKAHPEVHEQPVRVGAVIVGLGRSGSTLLQRLLAEPRRCTAIQWWESNLPVPLPGEVRGQPTERRALGRQAVDAMIAAAPDLLSMHPMDPFAADEEVMLLEQSFVSSAAETFLNVPGYGAWLERTDQRPAYRELREVLQLLTWQVPERARQHWILKTPHHLTALGAVVDTFPEAKIVMPHRDPVKTVVSWCSLVAALSAPNTDHLDLHRIGRYWSQRLKRNLDGFMAARDRLGPDHFVDVSYTDLTRDPVGTTEHILAAIGLPCDAQDHDDLRAWMARNGRESRAAHQYAAAEFGLDEEELARMFAQYRNRYLR